MGEGPYILEIYEPGSFYDTLVRFSSAIPFMSIHAGDIINPANWPAYDDTSTVLRVVGVEHIIWEITTPKHKICIFTEAIENSAETAMFAHGEVDCRQST